MYNIFWFRRDLRLSDNAGIYHALKANLPVKPIFIFDENILNKLSNKKDARVTFIFDSISELKEELKTLGSDLDVYYGNPTEIWATLKKDSNLNEVYTNRDYEQYAIQRDLEVEKLLEESNIKFNTFKDHVIFEKGEVLKDNGEPYVVFTPYKRRWLERLESKEDFENKNESFYFKNYPTEKYFSNFSKFNSTQDLKLGDIGFEKSGLSIPNSLVARSIIKKYDQNRDFPALNGTSKLGIHFRFGTISIREKAENAQKLNATFLSELIWRDFYSMILQHFPRVEERPFREKYERLEWLNNEDDFKSWCEGKTGYPIVDAGMRELNETGFMHNRVRMVAASFLTKHLLIDWKWGERYFAEKLLDYDLASNSGGWQWAAGCGTDAAPYFRIFNPYTQADKFDKKRIYINKWVPEVDSPSYPTAIVEHKFARERCLATYKRALS